MRSKKIYGKSIPLAIVFFIIIVGIIVSSILLKAYFIIRDGKFENGKFSIFLSTGEKNEIVSFKKDSVAILKIENLSGSPYKFLEVPIDSVYKDKSLDLGKPLSDLGSDIFFRIRLSENNLNYFDAIRIYFISRAFNSSEITHKEIPKDFAQSQRDQISSGIFSDQKILDEALKISVVNNTEESGAGNRIARLISNIGGQVLIVSTGSGNDKSGIYTKEDSYTAQRLSKVLNFPIIKSRMERLGDITVVVGNDSEGLTKY